MTKTIWKFEIPVADLIRVSMPKGAEILTVQMQNGEPCIWALVNPDAEKEEKVFKLLGTGHPFPGSDDFKYIGSFQMAPQLIFHLFELN